MKNTPVHSDHSGDFCKITAKISSPSYFSIHVMEGMEGLIFNIFRCAMSLLPKFSLIKTQHAQALVSIFSFPASYFFVAEIRKNLPYPLKCICQTMAEAGSCIFSSSEQVTYKGLTRAAINASWDVQSVADADGFYTLLALHSSSKQPSHQLGFHEPKIFPAMVSSL